MPYALRAAQKNGQLVRPGAHVVFIEHASVRRRNNRGMPCSRTLPRDESNDARGATILRCESRPDREQQTREGSRR
jgi:hypothetical protein